MELVPTQPSGSDVYGAKLHENAKMLSTNPVRHISLVSTDSENRRNLVKNVHEASLHRHFSRSAELKQASFLTPFISPVIGGQKHRKTEKTD